MRSAFWWRLPEGKLKSKRAGSAELKQNLGENIVRHTLLVDKGMRERFVKLAKSSNCSQANVLEGIMNILDVNEAFRKQLTEITDRLPKRQLLRSSLSTDVKQALRKVDPNALEEILKSEGVR